MSTPTENAIKIVGTRWRIFRTQLALAIAPWMGNLPQARHVTTTEGYIDSLLAHADALEEIGEIEEAEGVRTAATSLDYMLHDAINRSGKVEVKK